MRTRTHERTHSHKHRKMWCSLSGATMCSALATSLLWIGSTSECVRFAERISHVRKKLHLSMWIGVCVWVYVYVCVCVYVDDV